MTRRIHLLIAVLIVSFCGARTTIAQPNIQLLNAFTPAAGAREGSAEILAYSPLEHTVLSTMSSSLDGFGVQVLTLGANGSLTERGTVTFNSAFGAGSVASASSTAVDPLGRGFGVVSLIPTTNGVTAGRIGFFDYRSGSLGTLTTLDVGFHPDSVRFSADGSKIFVANEGEFTSGGATDAPGSVSIIDISSVANIGQVASLTNANVATIDFSAGNLGPGVSLANLRINDLSAGALANRPLHIEPEFMTQSGNQLFVSLQENNAIGVLDLTSNTWSAIHDLGSIVNTIDASDRDGDNGSMPPTAQINDLIRGLPSPDTIASYTVGGKTYLVTANEGDFRPDDADRSRVSAIDPANIDDATEAALNAIYGGNYRANSALGRLRVSNIDGDTDNDGQIEELTVLGTRSFSIYDAETGALVNDSGSLEALLFALDPARHNIDVEDPTPNNDLRSDDKGPEPEGLTVAQFGERVYAFIGMERQNGLLWFDITDPTDMKFVDYINILDTGLISPESLLVIDASVSPTGSPLLLVGYEGINSATNGIGVFSLAIPEPASLALWSLLGMVAVSVTWRYRRRV